MISDLQRQLGIDTTFFAQFLIFLLIFSWLQFIYFRPFLALLQKRERQSGGMSDDAAKLEEAADRDEKAYSDSLQAARRKAAAEREQILAVARKQASDSIAEARGQAKGKLEQARDSAAKSAASELESLKSQVGSVASLLVEKLTKTRVGL